MDNNEKSASLFSLLGELEEKVFLAAEDLDGELGGVLAELETDLSGSRPRPERASAPLT